MTREREEEANDYPLDAMEWVAAGSPLPPHSQLIVGLEVDVKQLLWRPAEARQLAWEEAQAVIGRLVTSRRWGPKAFEWRPRRNEAAGEIVDPDGRPVIRVSMRSGRPRVERVMD